MHGSAVVEEWLTDVVQISGHFEGLVGKRLPLKGESAQFSLEVVKYDKGSKGAQTKAACCSAVHEMACLLQGICRGCWVCLQQCCCWHQCGDICAV